jgi:hypothetical protein
MRAIIENARAIRDRAIGILKEYGEWESVGPVKVLTAGGDDMYIQSCSPRFFPKSITAMSYDDALSYQEGKKIPCAELWIWARGKKVFQIWWDDHDQISIEIFQSGDWPRLLDGNEL